jgi:predicted amidohydrolase
MSGALTTWALCANLCCDGRAQDSNLVLQGESSPGNNRIKVAAIQLSYLLGDVLGNLNKVADMVTDAGKNGARWIVLPEYFPSGIAWHPSVINAALPVNGLPTMLLKDLAKKTGAWVAGTFLAQRGHDTYNTLVLAHPSGQTYFHDKDLPTGPLEAAHWIGGTDNGIFDTPEGKIGAAICWEQIRFRTARQLREGGVGLILAPSAFGALEDEGRAGHVELLEHAPENLARLVGAPVILSNPVGPVEHHVIVDGKSSIVTVSYLGNSQIVDGRGNVVARRGQNEGEGILYGTIDLGSVAPSEEMQDRFWIPEMPKYWLDRHENRAAGYRLYQEVIRPSRNGLG